MLLEEVGADPLALSRKAQAQVLAQQMQAQMLPCCAEMHIGFFFDGTNNNKDRDTPHNGHSNVARLFDAFEIGKNKIRIYIPGVGTKFEKETSDTGLAYDSRAGLGAGWGGEARINWALLQLTNQFYLYFTAQTLSDAMGNADLALVRKMSTDINLPDRILKAAGADEVAQLKAASTLGTLGFIVDTAAIEPNESVRKAVLISRRNYVRQKLKTTISSLKPKILKVRLSVFGFSRGAAEARVFCNWLADALDDGSLGGVPVEVDFLGIFDTVASVGLAQSAMFFSGHGGWGKEEYLRIPTCVKRTVHLVSAHEVRGSFPLDRAVTSNCLELVYPGVHSDLGGGYPPGDQGRGCAEDGSKDDTNKLSQIPLAKMYQEAVSAGVPLNIQAAGLPQRSRDALIVSPLLIKSFNDYIRISNAAVSKSSGGVTGAAHTQYAMYLRWRRLRLNGGPEAFTNQQFYKNAQKNHKQDAEDLNRANEELRAESEAMLKMENSSAYSDGWMNRVLRAASPVAHLYSDFQRAIWGEKVRQWREVKPYWNDTSPLDPKVIKLFDDYVHDSRAWFKPFGATSEDVWIYEQKARMQRLLKQEADYRKLVEDLNRDRDGTLIRYSSIGDGGGGEIAPLPVLGKDRVDLDNFKKDQTLPLESTGREPSSIWGYLRWRTHYVPSETLSEKAQKAWNEVASIPDKAVQAGRDTVKRTEDGVMDAAARILRNGLEEGKNALERSAADALRRLLGGGFSL